MVLGLLLLGIPPLAPLLSYFILPLGLWLLVSRPGTLIEWLWIGTVVILAATWWILQPDLFTRVSGASALFFGGLMLLLTVAGVRSLVHRAMLAVGTSYLGMAIWFKVRGIGHDDFRKTLITEIWGTFRLSSPKMELPEIPPASTGMKLLQPEIDLPVAQQVSDMATTAAQYLPAWLALTALASAWLAWQSYQRVASRPIGLPAAPFREFRFTDHFVWVLIISLALAFQTLPPWAADANGNVLVVTLVLYLARGAAIFWTILRVANPAAVWFILLASLLLFGPLLCGCVVLGVADTWFDLRRRLPPQGVRT